MTWLLRGLALVLAIGAIVAAFVGYRLSTQPPPAPPAAPSESVVQSLKPLRAGEAIRAEDVALRPVAARPAGSFAAPTEVVGRIPNANIAAGETLTRAHFPVTESHLLRSLRAGERAVAIKVDEVVGLGGFAQPGDQVDVLLFLRGSQETANTTSAQVVLSDVRLLAYGESLQSSPAESEGAAARVVGATERAANRPRTTTSAVLAVPEAAAARLMLAANSGALRLALRPPAVTAANAADSHLVRLAELAQAARPAAPAAARPPGAAVVIQEGTAVRTAGVPSR